MQQQTCLLPVALHGTLGNAAHGRDLGEREAAEELEVDELGERGIGVRELVQRVAQLGVVVLGTASAISVFSAVRWNSPPRFRARRSRM